MIVKIKIGDELFGLQLYENNHCEIDIVDKTQNAKSVEVGSDDVFGTEEQQVTVDLSDVIESYNKEMIRLHTIDRIKDTVLIDMFNENKELKEKLNNRRL